MYCALVLPEHCLGKKFLKAYSREQLTHLQNPGRLFQVGRHAREALHIGLIIERPQPRVASEAIDGGPQHICLPHVPMLLRKIQLA